MLARCTETKLNKTKMQTHITQHNFLLVIYLYSLFYDVFSATRLYSVDDRVTSE
jgi:hypothetical protein